MPILYVNGKRRGLRIRGRAAVSNPARRRYRRAAVGKTINFKSRKAYERWKAGLGKRYRGKARIAGGRAFRAHSQHKGPARKGRNTPSRSKHVAKGSRKRSRAMKRYWAKRRRAGKRGALGRTIAPKRRRRRRAATPKRSRRRRSTRRKRSRARRSTRRRRSRRRRSMKTGAVRRRKGVNYVRRSGTWMRQGSMKDLYAGVPGGVPAATKRLRGNPARRRRRRRTGRASYTRRRRTHRRTHRRRSRRSYRRYGRRRYRRNPGGFIVDFAKKAIPVALGFAVSRLIVNKVGPMLPVSALGTLQGPVMSVAALVATHFATSKIAALARHRDELMIGSALSAIGSVVTAFVPSLGAMVGLSDYVQMGDYIAVGGAPPLNERITLSDYIAVGGDGVQEELGLEEELGVEEELGNVLLGGLPGPTSGGLMKQVPSQAFIAPVPARSFTKQIPAAGGQYDASADIYSGIFSGKFGGG